MQANRRVGMTAKGALPQTSSEHALGILDEQVRSIDEKATLTRFLPKLMNHTCSYFRTTVETATDPTTLVEL